MLCFLFDLFKKRDHKPASELAWLYLNDQSLSGVKGGQPNHPLDGYKCDKEILAQKLTDTLNAYFSGGPKLVFGNHYEYFLVDYDIEELVSTCLGADSWSNESEEGKPDFSKNHPRNALPEWDDIFCKD